VEHRQEPEWTSRHSASPTARPKDKRPESNRRLEHFGADATRQQEGEKTTEIEYTGAEEQRER
jgi:hypothetical protein